LLFSSTAAAGQGCYTLARHASCMWFVLGRSCDTPSNGCTSSTVSKLCTSKTHRRTLYEHGYKLRGESRMQLAADSCGPSTILIRQRSRLHSAFVTIPGRYRRRNDRTSGSPGTFTPAVFPNERHRQRAMRPPFAMMHQPSHTQAKGQSDGQGVKQHILSADNSFV